MDVEIVAQRVSINLCKALQRLEGGSIWLTSDPTLAFVIYICWLRDLETHVHPSPAVQKA